MNTSEFFNAFGTEGSILALDIGSGTQDVLLAVPGVAPENWPRFVLPTPALRVAGQIRELTRQLTPIWLHGSNMGGGFAGAVEEHLKRGLRIAATPQAASALHDDIARVRAMGITITEEEPPQCPTGYAPVFLSDFPPGYWSRLLESAGLPVPSLIVAAAQDHGVHSDTGNREGRFRQWKRLLAEGDGDPSAWLYTAVPSECTRLAALQCAIGGGPVADTGTAAVLGALATPEAAERSDREGVLVVNVGNSHTTAFLVFRRRVLGIYEHHTGMLSTESLLKDLNEFRLGWLPDEQVRAAGGHGCVFRELPPEAEGFRPAFILGPRRELMRGHGAFIAPYGDMMLAGCHGLLHALMSRKEK